MPIIRQELYKIEVKLELAVNFFNPTKGWDVTVHVSEPEKGSSVVDPERRDRCSHAFERLQDLGVQMETDPRWGPVDLVAVHPDHRLRLIEVVGDAKGRADVRVQQALGRLVLQMGRSDQAACFGLAVPTGRVWHHQLGKIPIQIRQRLNIELYQLEVGGGTVWRPGERFGRDATDSTPPDTTQTLHVIP